MYENFDYKKSIFIYFQCMVYEMEYIMRLISLLEAWQCLCVCDGLIIWILSYDYLDYHIFRIIFSVVCILFDWSELHGYYPFSNAQLSFSNFQIVNLDNRLSISQPLKMKQIHFDFYFSEWIFFFLSALYKFMHIFRSSDG